MPTVCDSAEYHAGYRSCLATVSHYLLASDADRDSRSIMLTHLRSGSNLVPDFSTAESEPARIPATTCTLRRSHKAPLETDATFPNLQQTSDRYYCSMPKKIEICETGQNIILTHRLEPMDPRSSKPHTSVLKIQRLTSAAIFWSLETELLAALVNLKCQSVLTLRLYKVALILLLMHCRSYFW